MSKTSVRQRIQTNSLNVADGLERLQDDLLELFNSHLDKFREEVFARDEETRAMVVSLVNELGVVKAGIQGLSVQIADLVEARRGDGT